MPKTSHRYAQQWDHWWNQVLGQYVLEHEKKYLYKLLANFYGKHTLLIGTPLQNELLNTSVMACHELLTLVSTRDKFIKCIQSEYYDLPIATASIDLVLLPHTLETIPHPRKLLIEACRIVKPEGHILILGFNPMSFWGLRKFLSKDKTIPWSGHFNHANVIKKWLKLADFELVDQGKLLYCPPVEKAWILKKCGVFEWLGSKVFKPFGGVYMLMAKAKVIPLTPIRFRWQQKLPTVRVSIPRPTMRETLKK